MKTGLRVRQNQWTVEIKTQQKKNSVQSGYNDTSKGYDINRKRKPPPETPTWHIDDDDNDMYVVSKTKASRLQPVMSQQRSTPVHMLVRESRCVRFVPWKKGLLCCISLQPKSTPNKQANYQWITLCMLRSYFSNSISQRRRWIHK